MWTYCISIIGGGIELVIARACTRIFLGKDMIQSLDEGVRGSSRRRIFPELDFGIASIKLTFRTFLYGAT